MSKTEQRLAALEAAISTILPSQDQITMAEWLQWHKTGEQPQRWIGNASIQSWVQQTLERRQQIDAMMAEYYEAEAEMGGEMVALTTEAEW